MSSNGKSSRLCRTAGSPEPKMGCLKLNKGIQRKDGGGVGGRMDGCMGAGWDRRVDGRMKVLTWLSAERRGMEIVLPCPSIG